MQLGYFNDNFVKYFAKNAPRRPPLINRGYYSRVSAIRRLITRFHSLGGCQVLSLGAGFDTNYFHFKSQGITFAKYVELDFQTVVLNKAALFRRQKPLQQLFEELSIANNGEVCAKDYYLGIIDLRDLDAVKLKLDAAGLDFSKPTIILSECVLVYLPPRDSDALIQFLSAQFTTSTMVVYEQILPHDPFGKTMLKNLAGRGTPLLSVESYPTVRDQRTRFLNRGWSHVMIGDMNAVYERLLDPAENARVEKIEIFDELEEWYLIQAHYCLVIAVTDRTLGHEDVARKWRALAAELESSTD